MKGDIKQVKEDQQLMMGDIKQVKLCLNLFSNGINIRNINRAI